MMLLRKASFSDVPIKPSFGQTAEINAGCPALCGLVGFFEE